MTTRVIYHMDSDGKAAAATVAHFLETRDIVFIPINYGMPLDTSDWDKQQDHVYIVDFTFQPLPKMLELVDEFPNLIWIDHHATAIALEKEAPKLATVKGLRDTSLAGCELTWKFFSDTPVPKSIVLIGSWDTWRRGENWETEVVPFQSFLHMNDDRPQKHALWKKLLKGPSEEDFKSWLNLGKIARLVQDRSDASLVGAASFVGKFAGHKAILCNGAGSSRMFEMNYRLDNFDLMVLFQLKQGSYVSVSIYGLNKEIDCGQLAKRLGEAGDIPSGGGHPQAAGFQCSWEYLWTLIKDVEDGKPWRISSTRTSISDIAKI